MIGTSFAITFASPVPAVYIVRKWLVSNLLSIVRASPLHDDSPLSGKYHPNNGTVCGELPDIARCIRNFGTVG